MDHAIYTAAKRIFEQVWSPGQAVRLLGVGAGKLGSEGAQLSLWDDGGEKRYRIQEAVDSLRDRFGDRTVRWGKEKQRGDS